MSEEVDFIVDSAKEDMGKAIKHLESRGVNMDLIWGNAELSANAQTALNKAVLQAREKNDRVIGREDLLEALFTEAYSSDSTVDQDWLVAQHVPPTSGTAAMLMPDERSMAERSRFETKGYNPSRDSIEMSQGATLAPEGAGLHDA